MDKPLRKVSVSEVEFYEMEDARSYIRDCLGTGSPFFKAEILETKDGTFVARLYRKPESKKLWHSHSEKPEKDGPIMEFLNVGGILGRMQLFQYNSQINWEKHCEECRVAQWAYEEEWRKA